MMKQLSPWYALVASTAFLLLSGVPLSATHAADASPSAAGRVGTTAGTAHAAGASEDSLQACLARIPKDATVGQRLIAEQSCRRDDGDRKPFQATLGR